MPTIFCGIDLGTQGARCALVRDDGHLVGEAERPLRAAPTGLPEGWSEQEPGAWMEAVEAALQDALGQLDTAPPIVDHVVAVGVTSTSGTLVVLDVDHRPIVPAIMYNDSRSRPQAGRVQDAGADLSARLGYRFGSSFGLPKVLWLREQRPEIYERAALFVSPADFIIGRLTGEWGRSDQTNMLKFGYDLLEQRWPPFIADALGIDRARLPRVQTSGSLAGNVTREAAARTGLPAGLPVVAGMTDGCASQVSSGAVAPGQWNTTLGTTMVIKGVSRELLLDPFGRIYCHRHPAGWWLPGGASNTGCECLAREFGEEETAARSAAALDHAPTSLVSYPLVRRGERFPFNAPDAEGFLLGEPRDRDELFVAYLEGVACLERLAYETLDELGAEVGDAVFSAGGGSKSDAWLQIRADVLGRAVLRPEQTGAATGAAILAAGLQHYEGLEAAAQAMVRIEKEVAPRPDFTAPYAEKYARFREECMTRGYLERPWPGTA